MKKILALVAVLSIALLVFGCSQASTPTTKEVNQAPITESESEEFESIDDFDDMEKDIVALEEDPGFEELENLSFE
ncbi:hypothetical protein HYV86_02855 [Candidatus Woesearchaeota archaeon]|nr:hypothetical protein [Candidatus Woesearchaeota archaeon]